MRARLHSGLPQSASAGMAPSAGRSILQGETPLTPLGVPGTVVSAKIPNRRHPGCRRYFL